MALSATRVRSRRPGRWVAAVGLIAALAGTQGSFFVYQLLSELAKSQPVSVQFFGMPFVSKWAPYAIAAVLGIALLAALFGGTLLSLAGSLLAAGAVAVLPLPLMHVVGGLGYDSTFELGTGYYVMVAGCGLAAVASAIDVRRRLDGATSSGAASPSPWSSGAASPGA